ncbi:uncharacterized protein LOC115631282 [Scaptodrosophila lebanonensis]|uniref:Uncharacterized protein LOC115631282 n=1 Tax=Drosophila lebanonensis TaxID=7225 RepID=A0A6J2U6B2_DROLE|nr:uncharacterized protein LOC115631282 [Scaptodrosophila lebanonensis]
MLNYRFFHIKLTFVCIKLEDSPLRRRHNILSPARSISVDRYKYVISEERDIAATRHMPTIMRKQTSLGDSADTSTSAYISRAPIRENSGQAFEGGDKPLEFKRSMSFTRRCSVPVSINYQTVQVVHHSGAHLQRRSSNINMGSLTGMNLDMQTNSILETKRRVRMINRH